MKNKKRVFLLLMIIFLGVMLYVSYDISMKTTFPGSSPQLKERLMKEDSSPSRDTIPDSLDHK